MKPVILYIKPFCGFCVAAKHLLKKKGVEYEEINISFNPKLRSEMIQRSLGGSTVPQIFIGDQHIGGYTEISALEREGRLDPLLAG
jgi:glutaredoxin 3